MAGYGNERFGQEQHPPALSARLLKLGLFVGITGALLYSLLSFVHPQYRSATTLYIESPRASSATLVRLEVKSLRSEAMLRSFLEGNSLSDDPAFNNAASQQGPVKRVSILLGFASDPAKIPANKRILANLQENLSVTKGDDPQTIKIAMRSFNAKAAARLANQYAQNYIVRLEVLNASRGSTPRSFAISRNGQGSLLSGLRDKIAASEARLTTLRQDLRLNPVTAPAPLAREVAKERAAQTPETSKLTLEQLSQITAQLILARADRQQAELRAKLVRDMLVDDGRIESTSTVLNSGVVQALLLKRARMEQKRSELTVKLLPSHPQMRRLNRQLVALGFEIKGETKKAVANLENEVLIASAREDSIKTSLEEQKQTSASDNGRQQVSRPLEVQSAPPIAIDSRIAQMAMIKGLLADNRRKLMMVKAQADSRSKNEQASANVPAKATVVSPAVASRIPVFPKKKPITLLGMLAALILGLVAMIFGNKSKVQARDEEEQSNLDVFAKAAAKDTKNSAQLPAMGFGAKPA